MGDHREANREEEGKTKVKVKWETRARQRLMYEDHDGRVLPGGCPGARGRCNRRPVRLRVVAPLPASPPQRRRTHTKKDANEG